MRTTIRISFLTVLAVLALSQIPAAQRPPAPAGPRVQFNTTSGMRDSTNFNEPFAVQVDLPAPSGGTPPAEITVTLSNGKGQSQNVTLTRYKNTNSYVSQTITVAEGAQKTGAGSYLPGGLSRSVNPIKVENGDTMTVSVQGGPSTSITVYENASKQAIARNLDTINRRSDELATISKTASDGIRAIDKALQTTTDPAIVKQLQEARAELVKQRDIAQQQSAALAEARRLMRDPDRDDLPIWRYTDQFKLAISNELIGLSMGCGYPRDAFSDAFDRAATTARRQWDEIYKRFQIEYALGWYQATASFSLAGPTMTAIGGVTIMGKEATLGERLSAVKELAIAAALIKGLPKAVDIAGEKLAGEFGGYKAPTATGGSVGGAGGGRREPAATERPTEVSRPGRTAPSESSRRGGGEIFDSFNREIEIARANNVPEAEIQRIVNESMEKFSKTGPDALAEGRLNLVDSAFSAKNPGASLVTDLDQLQLIRAARIKAGFEAQGKPQKWTSAEADMLEELKNGSYRNAYEYEDPFDPVTRYNEAQEIKEGKVVPPTEESGYTQLVNDADAANISKAPPKSKLNIVDEPVDPVIQKKRADFRAKQKADAAKGAKPEPTAPQPTGRSGPGGTVRLRPGEIPNTVAPKAGELQPQFSLRELRDAIATKRVQDATRTETGKRSPVSGDRVDPRTGRTETEVVRPESLKQLTAEEIRRLTPEDIRRLPPQARDALPVERLNGRQLKALAEAQGIPTGPRVTRTSTGMEGGAGAVGSTPRNDIESKYQGLNDLGRRLVEDDPPAPVPTSVGVNPIGTVKLNPDGTLTYFPFGEGAGLPGFIGSDGAITVTVDSEADPPRTETFSPSPISGGITLPDGSSVLQFPPTIPGRFGGPMEPAPSGGVFSPPETPRCKAGTPLPPATGTIGSPISYTVPGRSAGWGEDPDDPKKETTETPSIEETIDVTDDPIGPSADGPIDVRVQLFMGGLSVEGVLPAPHSGRGAVPPALGPFRFLHTLRELIDPRRGVRMDRSVAARTTKDALWLAPLHGDESQPRSSGARTDVKAVFISLGVATGEAFEVQVINDGLRPINLLGDGVVLEALTKGPQDAIRKQMLDALKRRGANAPAAKVARMSAYCMEYLKQPPTPGSIFRLASTQFQEKYEPLRKVLQSAQKLEKLGLLQPDSNPLDYYHSIRQWALWTKEQGFSPEAFGKAFVDHAKKNFEAAKQSWTKQIEAQVRGLVPHRWQQIATVLREAEKQIGNDNR